MYKIGRREFLGGALASSLVGLAARGEQGVGAKIEVLLNEPVGTISPDIYGHFVEHLGAVVYDGIWVGERSKVPNMGGIRTAMVEHLRRVKPSVMRYPGGCFADSYDWRDGIGPRARRPRRRAGQRVEAHAPLRARVRHAPATGTVRGGLENLFENASFAPPAPLRENYSSRKNAGGATEARR